MKPVSEQLTQAYRNERDYYRKVDELVREQMRIMERQPDPGAVLELCRQVEDLMAEIATIEEAIEPAKKCWAENQESEDEELDRLLGAIERMIEEISENQERVGRRLMAFVKQQQEGADDARRSIDASRARSLYKAG